METADVSQEARFAANRRTLLRRAGKPESSLEILLDPEDMERHLSQWMPEVQVELAGDMMPSDDDDHDDVVEVGGGTGARPQADTVTPAQQASLWAQGSSLLNSGSLLNHLGSWSRSFDQEEELTFPIQADAGLGGFSSTEICLLALGPADTEQRRRGSSPEDAEKIIHPLIGFPSDSESVFSQPGSDVRFTSGETSP